MMVVLHHVLGGNIGWMGVEVFFIISGFILPYSLYKSDYTTSGFGNFMLRRLVRIEPPYICSILLALALNYAMVFYNGVPYTPDWPNVFGHLAYLNLFIGKPWLNAVYWTLAIEFEYYIILALLYPLMAGNKSKIILFFALLCSTYLPLPQVHIFYYMPFFLFGICTFLYEVKKVNVPLFIIMLLATSWACFSVHGWVLLLLSLATILCILLIKKVNPVFLFLGDISYSLYLTHNPIHTRILAVLQHIGITNRIASVSICLIVIMITAYLFYILIEKRFHLLSKKIGFGNREKAVTTPT